MSLAHETLIIRRLGAEYREVGISWCYHPDTGEGVFTATVDMDTRIPLSEERARLVLDALLTTLDDSEEAPDDQ